MAVSKTRLFVMLHRALLVALSIQVTVLFVNMWRTYKAGSEFIISIPEGLYLFMSLTLAILVYDIANRKPSDRMSFMQIFLVYATSKVFLVLGIIKSRKFLKASRDPKKAQADVLLEMVKSMKDTAFGKDNGFSEIHSIHDFRLKMPITDYSYYEEYMERVANGEQNVIVPSHVNYITLTSGTTGSNKKLPLSNAMKRNFFSKVILVSSYLRKTPYNSRIRKTFLLFVPPIVTTNEAGIRTGASSGSHKAGGFNSTLPGVCMERLKDGDEKTIMYLNAVFGLLHDDITSLGFSFISLGRSFMLTLESRWKDIVDDIKSGKLNRDLEIDLDLRRRLEKEMWADPKRATALEREFRKGFDDIISRIWPEVEYVQMACAGTLQTPALNMQRKYFPDLSLVCTMHLGTEGVYGVCFNPGDIKKTYFTPMVHFTFFEFIPVEEIECNNPRTKLIHEVETGKQYELCVTTDRGLCRYRIGDIVEIVGHYNMIPTYKFIGRHGQLLDVCGEKVSEYAFNLALEETFTKLPDFALVDYTTAENWYLDNIGEGVGRDGYYLLFLEVEPRGEAKCLRQEQKDMFDEALQTCHEDYRDLRRERRIKKMKVIECKRGAFHNLKSYIISQNPKISHVQFKTPRVVRAEDRLRVLVNNASDTEELEALINESY